MANVFVSHSSKDKKLLVQPLVDRLHQNEHKVWYDSESLKIGDSVTLAISDGLAQSQFYLPVISSSFLGSPWCMKELGAIVSESIGKGKRLLILRVDDAEVPPVISDIRRLDLHSGLPDELASAAQAILDFLAGERWREPARQSSGAPGTLVREVLKADRTRSYGANLLAPISSENSKALENEGLILIKPGGTFNEPCLAEIFKRLSSRCRICQVRLFDGPLVDTRKLFDSQYVTPTRIARGEIVLTDHDRDKIREIYDKPEFQSTFGIPYSDDLIIPALKLCEPPYHVGPAELAELWEQGRQSGLFHNHRWNGLNKIGYQKSVFPIRMSTIPPPTVRIVLNGFIPGYRHLFTNDSARVVAIHASSEEPWRDIRDSLVGGDSDPLACPRGSIRRDAAEGMIPLAPEDDTVNGQRNVCHSSATLFDGMRELMTWFEYDPTKTLLGRVLSLNGLKAPQIKELTRAALPDISWWTRNESATRLLFDIGLLVAKDELRGDDATFRGRVSWYAKKTGSTCNFVVQHPAFLTFIQNGVRLQVAGEDLYLRSIAKLFEDQRDHSAFYEVARFIKSLALTRADLVTPEVLAEAYRVAAGDLLFTRCPAYAAECDSPELFKAMVIGELPEQALACALRCERNLVKDFQAVYAPEPDGQPVTSIGESPAWQEFVSQMPAREDTKKQIAALILCGGRSTRMASTIPKPVLPLRKTLLFSAVSQFIIQGCGDQAEVFAAVGFRSALLRRALGSKARYLDFEKTLGLAFRVATCLEMLGNHEGLVVLAYTDMPAISPESVKRLVQSARDSRTFGLLRTDAHHLSGHLIERNGKILRVVQQRLNPDLTTPRMPRDVGVYAFHNTTEFREALKDIRNDNNRREYIFADIVQILSERGWTITGVDEDFDRAYGVNTSGELLGVACGAYRLNLGQTELNNEIANTLSRDYRLKNVALPDVQGFRELVRTHTGPLHFFQWWDDHWQ